MYHEAVWRSVRRLIKEFQSFPFDFLFEADLQARFAGLLREELNGERVEMTWQRCNGGNPVQLSPVKLEYKIDPRRRVDIVCLDPDAPRPDGIDDETFFNRPFSVAIELKFHKFSDTLGHWAPKYREDLLKLSSLLDDGWLTAGGLGVGLFCVHEEEGDHWFEGNELHWQKRGKHGSLPLSEFREQSPGGGGIWSVMFTSRDERFLRLS